MVISIDSTPARRPQESAPDLATSGGSQLADVTAGAERRWEPRYAADGSCAIATIVGDPASRTLCRIVDGSRAGLRIQLNTPFAVGAQVHVQWNDRFFIGDCCYKLKRGDGYILGLNLVTSNYGRFPGKASFALGRLVAFCRTKAKGSLA